LTPVTDGGPEFPEAYVNLSAEVTGLVPAGVVTVTSTAPWAPAGAVTVIDVAVNAVTLPALAPKLTVGVPGVKLVPEMVTTVPPAVVPEPGLTPLTVGPLRYVKVSAAVAELVPFGVVTVTSTFPVPAGAVALMDVSDPTVKGAGTDPKRTAVAPVKAVPAT